MAGNVEVLRGAYAAFERGDMTAVADTWDADIEYAGPGAAPQRGKDQVERLFNGMRERWEGLVFSPEEFLEQGETVVVLGHLEGRAKTTGADIKVPFAHVWRMRGGKVHAGRAFTDTAAVADALGN